MIPGTKIEDMASHIVSEVQYDMRHGKSVSSSCEYVERRLKEMVAFAEQAAREEEREAREATDRIIELVRRRDCCDGYDAFRTDEMEEALAALDAIRARTGDKK